MNPAPAILLLLSIRALGASPCPVPVSVSEFDERIVEAEAAYGDVDVEGFFVAVERLDQALPCLSERLRPESVSQAQRVWGIKAWSDGDEEKAGLAFAAARAVDPDLTLWERVIPVGHPLHALFERSLPADGPPPPPLPHQSNLAMFVDGRRATLAPADRPYVFQAIDQQNAVVVTAVVHPGEMPPIRDVAPEAGGVLRRSFEHAWSTRWIGAATGFDGLSWTVAGQAPSGASNLRNMRVGIAWGVPWTPIHLNPGVGVGLDWALDASGFPGGDGGTPLSATATGAAALRLGASVSAREGGPLGLSVLAGAQVGGAMLVGAFVDPVDGDLVSDPLEGVPVNAGYIAPVVGGEFVLVPGQWAARVRGVYVLPHRVERGELTFRWSHFGLVFAFGGIG